MMFELSTKKALYTLIQGKLAGVMLVVTLLLQACSGGSGGGASDRQAPPNDDGGSVAFSYVGDPPASPEIQSFKLEFFDNLVLQERCGSCHTRGGVGPAAFVDNDDINFAWQEAGSVVDLDDPAESMVVQRVGSGHNCWLGTTQTAACATTMQGYIEAWATASQPSSEEVQLTPVEALSPTETKLFPQYPDLDPGTQMDPLTGTGPLTASPSGLLYLLNTHCSDCHSDTSSQQQSPFFASDDPQVAYDAVRSKINLNNPASSRVVQRLGSDSHNCWSNDCDSDADDMTAAISQFAATITATQVDPDLLISRALVLDDQGIVASTGGRFETDVIAKWEFREGQGTLVSDTSGVQPEVPLTLTGAYDWLGGWGITLTGGKAQGAVSGSNKLRDLITATGEFTIEAWVAPANVSQENAWIVGYTGGSMSRNFLMTQNLYDYDFYNRSSVTEDNGAGDPALSTDDDAEFAQATLQHVVMTFDPLEGRRIYVNGEYTGDVDEQGGGILESWNASFAVVLGNSTAQDASWQGVMRMVAIHNRALNEEQIVKNYDVGVGAKFFLLFSVSEILDRPGECHDVDGAGARTNYCYVAFEVSQFDASSYLFNQPFFVSLNNGFNPDGFAIKGIRIGVNGREVGTGQGFTNVSATIDATSYTPEGQVLSDIGTVIALENGSDQDMFFLAFDEIDGQFDQTTAPGPLAYSRNLSGVVNSDIGFRTFEQMSASFSAITGVPMNNPVANGVFQNVKQSMPVIADFQAYLSSHQMAVTQLAMGYCSALVDDTGLRDAFFGDATPLNFAQQADAVSDADWDNKVILPLLDNALSITSTKPLASQPDRDAIRASLLAFITDPLDNAPYENDPPFNPVGDGDPDGLARCSGSCNGTISTGQVVKAVCGSVLGSTAVLMK